MSLPAGLLSARWMSSDADGPVLIAPVIPSMQGTHQSSYPRPAESRSGGATARTDFIAESDRIKSLAVHDVRSAIAAADTLLASALNPRESVRALSARAHARAYANDFARVTADLDEAIAIATQFELHDEVGPLLLVQVQPLARGGRLAEAEQVAARACRELQATDQPMLQGKALVNLGIVRRMRGAAADSLECFSRAAPLLAADPASLAAVHSNRAVALLELDRFDDATAAFSDAMHLLRDADRSHAAAIVSGNIADLLARSGRIDDAIVRFEEARRLFVAAGAEADAARLTAEEAEALFAVGAYVKCIRLLTPALDALDRGGLAREHARASLVLGLANLRAGNLNVAAGALTAAKAQAEAASSDLLIAEAHIALCELSSAAADFPAARLHGREAVRMLSERPVRQATAMMALASVELDAGDPNSAARQIDAIRAGLGPTAPAPLRARLAQISARILRANNQPQLALRKLQDAIAIVESFRGEIRAEQIRTAYLESTQRLFLDVCELAREVLAPAQAQAVVFDAIERIRGRTLLDALGAVSVQGTRPRGESALPDSAEMNALYSALGPTSTDSAPALERRRARLRELETIRDAGHDRTSSGTGTHGGGMLHRDPLPLLEAISRLDPAEAVVSLYPDRAAVCAQVLRAGRSPEIHELAPLSMVSSLCRRFRLALARSVAGMGERDSSAARSTAIELRRVLLGPLHAALSDAAHIRLMPFGDLHGVPLHCAEDPAENPARTSPLRAVSYLPGMTIAAALADQCRAQPESRPGSVLIVGVGDDLAPRIEPEARSVAACHPRAVTLLGAAATANAVLDSVQSASLVHLACHALFDPAFPTSSRLKLADRWVTARELAGRFRPGATIVLAGCETGRMSDSAGEDRFGIVRALLASGAGAVLAAAWPLHDSCSQLAMVAVHRALVQHPAIFARSLPFCLAQAQRELLADGQPFDQWASLYVSGALL